MARAPVLGGSSRPFGDTAVDFSAFDLGGAISQQAYLVFVKAETAWNRGEVSDADYLTALDKYAHALQGAERINTLQRLEDTRYRIERNVLVERINGGKATLDDLLSYDAKRLDGVKVDSQEYLQRLDTLRTTQNQWLSEQEEAAVQQYSDGHMTTTQLQAWYKAALANPKLQNNPDLTKQLNKRVKDLGSRVQDERDSKMISDFADGHVTYADFLTYATAARARFSPGTQQARDWDDRINKARDQHAETQLLYRYNLSQQYAQLEKFVKSNSGKPTGGSSTSTRTILGADGQWHTVETTKATAPSKAEQKAYEQLQRQIVDAKRQMGEITTKMAGLGGFVTTPQVQHYYTQQLARFSKGSEDWYRIQEKLDSLNDRSHAELVLGQDGVKITYPNVASGGGSSTAAGVTLNSFMRAIARQESGGRYEARNSTTGAYGKYQILPSNWSSWAVQAGLPANAKQTPENQEKVARAAFQRLAARYKNDWSLVAAAWHAGVAGTAGGPGTGNWGPKTTNYVNSIMRALGSSPSPSASTRLNIAGVVGGGYQSQGYSDHHDGIDIAAKAGSPIYAVADGVVSYAQDARRDANAGKHWAIGGGNVVEIDIGGNKTAQYAHMERYTVKAGQRVKKGELIGYVGMTGNATGPHLHFGLWDHNTNKMIDPGTVIDLSSFSHVVHGTIVATHSLGGHPGRTPQEAKANFDTSRQVAKAIKDSGYTPQQAYQADQQQKTAPPRPTGGLLAVTSVTKAKRGGQEIVHTKPVGFPANMDGAAFEDFFKGYERAFASGAETFVDANSGVAYFIGTDALGRIERMRQLDDMRVKLYTEKAQYYGGTSSGISAANQRNDAVHDAATHEFLILDMASKGQMPPSESTNPIAAGIRILDKQEAAIQSEIALAKSAFEQGDVTTAFGHLQNAERLTKPVGSTASLEGFADVSQQAVAAITAAYGGITLDEAGVGEKYKAELDRLTNWSPALNALLEKGGGTELLNEIKALVQTDRNGNVMYDLPGTNGKIKLRPEVYFELGANGKVTPKTAPLTGYNASGDPVRKLDGYVSVRIKVGDNVLGGGDSGTVQAKYQIVTVGHFLLPDGSQLPILGKQVVTKDADGHDVQFVENPLNPGHWSNKPIVINAPQIAKIPAGPPDTYNYQFKANGSTFTLIHDPKTGLYTFIEDNPGAAFSAPIQQKPWGDAGQPGVQELLRGAGFALDTTTLGPNDFADVDTPVFGLDRPAYEAYQQRWLPTYDRREGVSSPMSQPLQSSWDRREGASSPMSQIKTTAPTSLEREGASSPMSRPLAPLPPQPSFDRREGASSPMAKPLPGPALTQPKTLPVIKPLPGAGAKAGASKPGQARPEPPAAAAPKKVHRPPHDAPKTKLTPLPAKKPPPTPSYGGGSRPL